MSVEYLKEIINSSDQKDHEIARLNSLLHQEKLQHKHAIQELKDYYENILALMPGHVYWLDKNNVFLGCNDLQAKNAGLASRKDICGKTNYDLPWKEQAEELNQLNKQVMTTGVTHTAEEYVVMEKGIAIYLSQKTPFRNKKNEVIGILGISIDITEHKRMEAALRAAKQLATQTNENRDAFIAIMRHDIQTPLIGIIAMTKHLYENIQDIEKKQHAQNLHKCGQQLLKLINELLMNASFNNLNISEVTAESFNLRECIYAIWHLLAPAAKMKNLNIKLEIAPNIPQQVITDGKKLHRILLNLIDNAINFTEKGHILIKITVENYEDNYAQIKFSITDEGIGIPEGLQDKVFERFFCINHKHKHLYATTTNKPYKPGIGLYVAQEYVNLLGGNIKLLSDIGKGSTFYFTLPFKIVTN